MSKNVLTAGNLIGYTEAARVLGVTRATVYNLAAAGKVRPVLIGRYHYLFLEEVERLREERNSQ